MSDCAGKIIELQNSTKEEMKKAMQGIQNAAKEYVNLLVSNASHYGQKQEEDE